VATLPADESLGDVAADALAGVAGAFALLSLLPQPVTLAKAMGAARVTARSRRNVIDCSGVRLCM
jgi:hypothetical protein